MNDRSLIDTFIIPSFLCHGVNSMCAKKNLLFLVSFLMISLYSMKETAAVPRMTDFYKLYDDFKNYENFCLFSPSNDNFVIVYDYVNSSGLHQYYVYDHGNRSKKNLLEYDSLKSKTIDSYSLQNQNGIEFILLKCKDNSSFAIRYSVDSKSVSIEPLEDLYGSFDAIKSGYGLMLGIRNDSLYRIDYQKNIDVKKLSENHEIVVDFDFIDSSCFWYSFKNDSGKFCLCHVNQDLKSNSYTKTVYSDFNFDEIRNVYSFKKSDSCYFSVAGSRNSSEKNTLVFLKSSEDKNEFLFERECDDTISGCEIFENKEKIYLYLTTFDSAAKKKKVFIGNENCTLFDREVNAARLSSNKNGDFFFAVNDTQSATIYKVDFDKYALRKLNVYPHSIVVGDYCSFKKNYLMIVDSEDFEFSSINLEEDSFKPRKISPGHGYSNRVYAREFILRFMVTNFTQRKCFPCGRYVLIDFGKYALFYDSNNENIDFFKANVYPISAINSRVDVIFESGSSISHFDFGEGNLQFSIKYNEFGE